MTGNDTQPIQTTSNNFEESSVVKNANQSTIKQDESNYQGLVTSQGAESDNTTVPRKRTYADFIGEHGDGQEDAQGRGKRSKQEEEGLPPFEKGDTEVRGEPRNTTNQALTGLHVNPQSSLDNTKTSPTSLDAPVAAKKLPEVTTHQESEGSADSEVGDGETKHECATCLRERPSERVLQNVCGHHMCGRCISMLHKMCLTNEALFPPQCCRDPIPFDLAQQHLTPELASDFQTKTLEYKDKNRTYCSMSACSMYLPADTINEDRAACPSCGTITCTLCKATAHEGDCPSDASMEQTLALAKQEGWQQCTSCKRVIELTYGCNHMSVRHVVRDFRCPC